MDMDKLFKTLKTLLDLGASMPINIENWIRFAQPPSDQREIDLLSRQLGEIGKVLKIGDDLLGSNLIKAIQDFGVSRPSNMESAQQPALMSRQPAVVHKGDVQSAKDVNETSIGLGKNDRDINESVSVLAEVQDLGPTNIVPLAPQHTSKQSEKVLMSRQLLMPELEAPTVLHALDKRNEIVGKNGYQGVHNDVASELEVVQASLCQKCGVTGYKELLVHCRKCRISAEHRYCLNKFPKKGEKVRWFCEQCKPRSPNIDSLDKLIEVGSIPCTSPGQGEDRRLRKHQRLILADEDQLEQVQELRSDHGDQNISSKATAPSSEPVFALLPRRISSFDEGTIRPQTVTLRTTASQSMVQDEAQHCLVACPIVDYVWRGYISFGGVKYGPLTAHLSTLACERVSCAAKLLPPVLCVEKLSRLDSWPNSFKNCPPTDDKIGLFFFPDRAMVDSGLDPLLDDAIQKDLLFKFMLDKIELLIFSSTVLPKDRHRFLGAYYLWGVFRSRQVLVSTSCDNRHSSLSELREEKRMMELSDENERDKEEGEGCDEESSDVNQHSNLSLSSFSVLQNPNSNELTEETQWSEDLHKHVGEDKRIEAQDKKLQEREEGEICDDYVEREEGEIFEEFNEGNCLQLFPLAIEDIGIVSKVGSDKELNLELGLSWQSVGKNGGHNEVLNSLL